MVEVKFCGLTRDVDAAYASALGASYAGVIFAGGPREVTADRARAVHDAGSGLTRVGVFGADYRSRITSVTMTAPLDVAQLHADPTVTDVREARTVFGGEVWAVVRVEGDALPDGIGALFGEADAVLLDARVPGGLGGSGVSLAWERLAEGVGQVRGGSRLVLAGGLRPENVGIAVAALSPDIVDVSSGVESAPGIKDHAKMQAFYRAANGSMV